MSDYRKDLAFFDPGRWLQIPREFLGILNGTDSIVLATLVNLSCFLIDSGEDEEGWIPCEDERLQGITSFHRVTLSKSLSRLMEKKLIEITRKGMPSRRWVRIDVDKVKSAITTVNRAGEQSYISVTTSRSAPLRQAQASKGVEKARSLPSIKGRQDDEKVKKGESDESNSSRARARRSLKKNSYININLNTDLCSSKNSSTVKNDPVRTKADKDDIAFQLAKDFAEKVWSVWEKVDGEGNRVLHPPKRVVREWANAIRPIHTRYQVSWERIEEVMEWYLTLFDREKHSGRNQFLPKFIPQARSGRAFADKFEQIESAMLRSVPVPPPDLPPNLQKKAKSLRRHLTFTPVGMDLLVSSISNWTQRLTKALEDDRYAPISKLYSRILIEGETFYADYAIWIDSEVTGWPGSFSGNLESFQPGEKHFRRYVQRVLKENDLRPPKALMEVMNG